jgi:hypothetical protein
MPNYQAGKDMLLGEPGGDAAITGARHTPLPSPPRDGHARAPSAPSHVRRGRRDTPTRTGRSTQRTT